MILRNRPDLDENQWFALMAQPTVSSGARALLEAEGRRRFGAVHYRATHRGSTAFDVLWAQLPLRPGDEVVMSTLNFVGVADSVVRAGGVPVLVDVAPGRLLAGARELAAGITRRTRAVIATHLFGMACDAPAIREMADRQGLVCIEDCAHALGVCIDNQPVGSFGQASVFSFGFEKHLTTGRGGALLIRESNRLGAETSLPASTRESDLEVLLGAWLEYMGSDPARCRHPFRLDWTGHEAIRQHPSLRKNLMSYAARGMVPDDRALRTCWNRVVAHQRGWDWWQRRVVGPAYRAVGRCGPLQKNVAPTLAAMGDLRAAVCRHELLRQLPICRERRRRSDRLTERLRSWTGGHIAPGIQHNDSQPLQLPLMVSDPARAWHLTGLARAQGIIIGPSPWGLPLHHYPELSGKVRLAAPSLPASEQAMQRLVLVPLHAGVTDEFLERIADLIQTVS